MDAYAIYLRKSRADEEAERSGQGETLSRHLHTLTEFAQRQGLSVAKVYKEIASADSIDHRPQMQQLLNDVQRGIWTGVICMDIDRLSRGGSGDQERVMRTFFVTGTLIVTPGKTYDLTQPSDEDFSEIKLFFARLEHKTIKRRLYAGRERSARDGWYLGTKDPYGYRRVYKTIDGRTGPTLEPIPEQVETVNQIFTWYASGHSSHTIADMLNDTGLRTNAGGLWTPSTVRGILRNVLYIGQISWGKRIAKPVMVGDGVIVKRPQNPDAIFVPGKHPGIVSERLWDDVRARLDGNGAPPLKEGRPLQNPLCGLVYCARCGFAMQRATKGNRPAVLRCYNRACDQICAPIEVVEALIVQAIDEDFEPLPPRMIGEDQPASDNRAEVERRARILRKQIKQAETQLGRLHDFLERGVYSVDEFLSRKGSLSQRLVELQAKLERLERSAEDAAQKRAELIKRQIPASTTVSQAYYRAASIDRVDLQNTLLKAIVERVDYDKTERRAGKYDDPTRGLVLNIKYLD